MSWLEAAMLCNRMFGVYVSYEPGDRWFECPECGEPILEEDWQNVDLDVCPICEFDWSE